METAKAKLTVLFDPPFWAGLFEREAGGRYEACKVIFGPEPSDQEVYQYLLDHYQHLEFSPALPSDSPAERRVSPKRAQRLAARETRETGIGTRAQQALQLQRERQKAQRQAHAKERREAELERKFALRQEKRRQKRRGH